MDIKNTYFGFNDNMNPMQKQKTENMLNKLIRYNNVICTEKEFIYEKLLEGGKPYIKYDYSYYSRKLDDYTKPKNDYRINNNNNTFNTINKTLYDYAVYLLENDFLNEQKANEFIIAEQNKIAEEKQNQIEQKRKIKEENELKQKVLEDFKNWHTEQANKYDNIEKLSLAREIFLNEIGEYNDFQLKRLLVLIENIENEHCRLKLIDWLHSGNIASKKVFFHITGIKLPSTNKGTLPILQTITTKDFTCIIQYKKRKENSQTKEITTETFYKMIPKPEPHFIEVQGESINKYGLDLFITESKIGYVLSEAKTGCMMTNAKTKKELFEKLNKQVEQYTIERINKILEDTINKYGLSPKYKIA